MDVTDVNNNGGFQKISLLRKLVTDFQPVNTGQLLNHTFFGKTVTLRCGRHLYLTVVSADGGSAVYMFDQRGGLT